MRFTPKTAFLAVAASVLLVGCSPPGPSRQSMEDFANKVITTAAGGDASAVIKLAAPDAAGAEAQAASLVAFAKGWKSSTDKLSYASDFPSKAHVTAAKATDSSIGYDIAWLNDRWILIIGRRTPAEGPTPHATPR